MITDTTVTLMNLNSINLVTNLYVHSYNFLSRRLQFDSYIYRRGHNFGILFTALSD